MQSLKHVIGMVMGTIRGALPALRTQDIQTGGNSNIAERQRQLVAQELKRKRYRAQVVTQEQSPKVETSCALIHTKKSSTLGTQQVTLAPQVALQNTKPKRSVAPSTTVAPLHKHVRKAVQVTNGDLGKLQAIPVFPILRPAKQQPKPKQKAVAPTTQVKKRTKKSTPVLTPMDHKSKVNGS
jgi:D-lyxose ketol-isomerase